MRRTLLTSFPKRDGEGNLFNWAVNPNVKGVKSFHSWLCKFTNSHIQLSFMSKGLAKSLYFPSEEETRMCTSSYTHTVLGQKLGIVITLFKNHASLLQNLNGNIPQRPNYRYTSPSITHILFIFWALKVFTSIIPSQLSSCYATGDRMYWCHLPSYVTSQVRVETLLEKPIRPRGPGRGACLFLYAKSLPKYPQHVHYYVCILRWEKEGGMFSPWTLTLAS